MHKQIKKVLMCRPDYFDIVYEINPWMKVCSVSILKAQEQWSNLAQIYQDLEIEVKVIEPNIDFPDMVFATDQGIIKRDIFISGNFRFVERQGESELYKEWLLQNGYIINHTQKDVCFEGGDCVMIGDKMVFGYGFRSDLQAAKEIEKILDIEVIPIKLINYRFYHLDTALFSLNSNTLFYVESAFERKSLELLSEKANLISIDEAEANNFAANSMVTNGHVIMTANNLKMKKDIEDQGYKVIEVDVSEFLKSGGGIHCLTLVLE